MSLDHVLDVSGSDVLRTSKYFFLLAELRPWFLGFLVADVKLVFRSA